jgi:hypothetical protein
MNGALHCQAGPLAGSEACVKLIPGAGEIPLECAAPIKSRRHNRRPQRNAGNQSAYDGPAQIGLRAAKRCRNGADSCHCRSPGRDGRAQPGVACGRDFYI